jgi:hypothetical protein
MARIKLDPQVAKVVGDFIGGVASAAKEAALDEVERQVHRGVEHVDEFIDKARNVRKKRRVDVRVERDR